jgi:hypothetical protein
MSPTTDDLRQVLAHASASTPPLGDLADAAARRGRTTRRRRTATVVAAVALAVGAAVVPNLPGRTSSEPPVGRPTPTPTATAQGDQPLPEYLRGGRLVATKAETDAKGLTLRWTPTSLAFGLAYSCANADWSSSGFPADKSAIPVLSVNGTPYAGTGCEADLSTFGDNDMGGLNSPDWAGEFGLQVGVPAVVRFEFPDPYSFEGTRFRVGVYEAVPLDEYPFPDRPDQLRPLDNGAVQSDGRRLVWGDGSGDSEGFTYTVPVERGLEVRVATVEPGEWRMLVNGVVMASARSWTYEQEGFGAFLSLDQLGIRPGDEVVLSFQTDRFTGNTYEFAVYDHALQTAR